MLLLLHHPPKTDNYIFIRADGKFPQENFWLLLRLVWQNWSRWDGGSYRVFVTTGEYNAADIITGLFSNLFTNLSLFLYQTNCINI